MKKLNSLSIFFPFYNDAGTVEKAIADAYFYGKKYADKLEVIAIHGGVSHDHTWSEILRQKKKHRDLIVIDKKDNNESYAVIKYGFRAAKSEWVFYTDGDLQYKLSELGNLVKKQLESDADVINGFKVNRGDNTIRTVLGNLYKSLSGFIFCLPIKDLTCDFRLIKRSFLDSFRLEAHDASILIELIKKLQYAKATFVEVPVSHRPRSYGKSTYSIGKLLKERVFGDIKTFSGLLFYKQR